jgi:hypothetical protein
MNHPLIFRTADSPPNRNQEALSLTYTPETGVDAEPALDLLSCLSACFKAHKRTTRLLLKHARSRRRLQYGQVLLHMFINKQRWPCSRSFAPQRRQETPNPYPRTSPSLEVITRGAYSWTRRKLSHKLKSLKPGHCRLTLHSRPKRRS